MDKKITKESILKRQKELKEIFESMLEKSVQPYDFNDLRRMVFEEKNTFDLNKIIELFIDKSMDTKEMNKVIALVSDLWNYFPHKSLDGLSPSDKLLKFEQKSDKTIQEKYKNTGYEFSNREFFAVNNDGNMYDYVLPSGATIDEESVVNAMFNNTKNRAFFLNLSEGDVLALDMNLESNKNVYKEMCTQIYSYIQIPFLDTELSDDGAEAIAFQNFIDKIPVKIKKIKADTVPTMNDCDCKVCELEQKCAKEGRSPSMEELKQAMRDAEMDGGIVGGELK